MRDDFTTKERTGAGTGEVLARLGYALAGALVAVLVSAMMSLVPWPADDTLFPVYVNASVMGRRSCCGRRSSLRAVRPAR